MVTGFALVRVIWSLQGLTDAVCLHGCSVGSPSCKVAIHGFGLAFFCLFHMILFLWKKSLRGAVSQKSHKQWRRLPQRNSPANPASPPITSGPRRPRHSLTSSAHFASPVIGQSSFVVLISNKNVDYYWFPWHGQHWVFATGTRSLLG